MIYQKPTNQQYVDTIELRLQGLRIWKPYGCQKEITRLENALSDVKSRIA